MTYLDTGANLVNVEGQLVERDALMIAEKVRDYDSDLQIICIDPSRASFTDAPFIVVRDKGNGIFEKVLEAWALDDKILERIWASDCSKNDVLTTLANMEMAKKREAAAISYEKSGHNMELGAAIIATPKSSFTYKDEKGDLVKIHESEPVTRNAQKKSYS